MTPTHVPTTCDRAARAGRRLKDRILTTVFPDLAGGFLADTERRPGRSTGTTPDELDEVFPPTLTLLYRLLILLYAEGRELLPVREAAYRVVSLRSLAEEIAGQAGATPDEAEKRLEKAYSPEATGLHDRLATLFEAVGRGAPALNVPALGGGLFGTMPDDRGATIARFLSTRKIPDRFLARAIDGLARDRDEGTLALAFIDYAALPVRHLGSIHESLLESRLAVARGAIRLGKDRADRKASGSYYTPDPIIEYIVAQAVGPALVERLESLRAGFREGREDLADRLFDLKVLDPAMGSGHFLVAAVQHITDRLRTFLDAFPADPVGPLLERTRDRILSTLATQGVSIDRARLTDAHLLKRLVLERCLYGVDLDPMSVELSKVSLWLEASAVGSPLSVLDPHLRCGNALVGRGPGDREETDRGEARAAGSRPFDWDREFPEVFPPTGEGFDAVIGNPPYVRMEGIKPLKPFLKRHYRCHADRADLFIYFYERAVKLLRPGGRMAFIASSTWTKTRAGRSLRDFLRAETAMDSFLDLGDLPVFEGVATYPCILVARRQLPAPDQVVAGARVGSLREVDLAAHLRAQAVAVPQSELGSAAWHFEDRGAARLRDRIREAGVPLGELCGPPLYGIKTGLNEAFVIDTTTRDRLVARDRRSSEILRPFLEGKDMTAWDARWRGRWLIYARHGIEIERYPAIAEHLVRFRERLERRATSARHHWYELQQPQSGYTPAFSGPKIVFPRFANRPIFALEGRGCFINNAISAIDSTDPVLLFVLMSPLTWFFLRAEGAPMASGYRQLHGHVIERLPIPRLDPSARAEIAAWVARRSGCQSPAPWHLLYDAIGLRPDEIARLEITCRACESAKRSDAAPAPGSGL